MSSLLVTKVSEIQHCIDLAATKSLPEWPTNCYVQKICILTCHPSLKNTNSLIAIMSNSMAPGVLFSKLSLTLGDLTTTANVSCLVMVNVLLFKYDHST